MNLKSFLKKISLPEILVLVVFTFYLIFPISTPSELSPYIESPLGLLVIFSVSVALFIYSNPVLAVLYLFVAYTLLRRSAVVKNVSHYVRQTKTSTQNATDAQKQVDEATPPHEEARNVNPNGTQPVSLEEEIVLEKAPIGQSSQITLVKSTFKPVATNTTSAASFI
jgi:hypothetical protein